MPTSTRCPECGAKITLDAGPGETGTCPRCFAEFIVPATAVAAAPAARPTPAPPATPAAKSSPAMMGTPSPVKKKKKKSGKKKEDRGPILNAITAIPERWRIPAVAALTAVVLGGVVLLAQLGGKKDVPDGGADAPAGADAATPQGFAVVDSVPGGGDGAKGGIPDEEGAPRKALAVAPLAEEGPPTPVKGWALGPDPPAAAPEPLAAEWGVPNPRNSRPPVFAGLNGPFVVVDDEPGPPPKPTEQAVGRATLYDLRTGKPAGFFRTGQKIMPFWGKSRLSPDGRWVVTEAVDGDARRTGKDGILYVYRQGEQTKPAAELKLPGHVAWLDFVAADRIAIYSFDPKPVIAVYRVSDGRKLQTIPIEAEMHPPPEAHVNVKGTQFEPKFLYDPHDSVGAVSPGGKLIALGGKSVIVVLSLSEGNQVAAIPIGQTMRWLDHHGISFHPDGTELYAFATIRLPNSAPRRLRGWSLETGRQLFDVPQLGVTPLSGRPLPGPDPGTMILTENPAVVDTTAGVVHFHLGFTPVRWSGKETLVGFGPYAPAPHLAPPTNMPLPDKKALPPMEYDAAYKRALFNADFQAVYTTRFNRAEYEKKAGTTLAATTPRPPVARGDRSGLAGTRPDPPAAWTAPPANTPPAPPDQTATFAAWPTAMCADHAASISFTYQPIPRPHYPVDWHRHDLGTGKTLGPPVRLWPWAEMSERHVTMIEKFPTPPAAVSDDGNRLAMRDPADPHRLDVWDAEGKRLGGFVPYDQKTPVEWLGWSGERLLTLGGGRLTGWSGPDGKAVFEVEGGYSPLVAMPPGRGWVAALAGDAIDILDGATGKCLARCAAPPGDTYLALAVAPDGKGLAAARKSAKKFERPSPKPVDERPVPLLAPAEYIADVWDLTTGKRESIPFGAGTFGFIHWTSPEHILTACGGLELIDRRASAVVELYYYPYNSGPAEGQQILAGTPDGRVWASIPAPDLKPGESDRRVWRTQALPDAKDVLDFTVLAPEREYLRPILGPIRVEVDLGTEDRSRRAAEHLAASLAKRGYAVGPRGWALRVSHEVVEGRVTLYTSTYEDGRKTPDVKFTWRLYALDGGMVWEGTATGSFRGRASRYHSKTKRGGSGVAPTSPLDPVTVYERVDYYDFEGKDMREAIVSEILDVAAGGLTEPPGGLPTAIIRGGGTSKPLPLARTITISSGP